jgi:hypothetical protein
MLCSGEGETGFLGAQRGARSVEDYSLIFSILYYLMVAVPSTLRGIKQIKLIR